MQADKTCVEIWIARRIYVSAPNRLLLYFDYASIVRATMNNKETISTKSLCKYAPPNSVFSDNFQFVPLCG